ncbi:hypothetical protein SBFV3_gp43 [Sulfolobales Beppu filamentous virus 3]|uniref:Uncharacterized protein n=1 Tax=Sulfolobales Beppu filamentous virus 3 TaxID=2493124 RepID=A0A3S8NF53_9VIRU|nr:hypothetical protein HOU83_gp43 [Sulfolobales Beppu filamentous virus 3]AZI75878.1 hypothetical protein SBFV3_gp43 [Sulfolobales Beppu filamentous virus 3]
MSSVISDIVAVTDTIISTTAIITFIITYKRYKRSTEHDIDTHMRHIANDTFNEFINSVKFKDAVNYIIDTNKKINEIDTKLTMLLVILCTEDNKLKQTPFCQSILSNVRG